MKKTHPYNGLFVVFEGIDGCGKTTQANHFEELLTWLLHSGYEPQNLSFENKNIIRLREPGSTSVSESIRSILLGEYDLNKKTNSLLFYAARSDLLEKVVVPSLKKGNVVLMDRFYHSTTAYQSAQGMNKNFLDALREEIVENVMPDTALYYNISIETSEQRRNIRVEDDSNEQEYTSYDRETREFFEKVKSSYKEMVSNKELVSVDANNNPEQVFFDTVNSILPSLQAYLKRVGSSHKLASADSSNLKEELFKDLDLRMYKSFFPRMAEYEYRYKNKPFEELDRYEQSLKYKGEDLEVVQGFYNQLKKEVS